MSNSPHLLPKYEADNSAEQAAPRMPTNVVPCAQTCEPKKAISEPTIAPDLRKRIARVEVLQNLLGKMLALSAARALEYSYNAQGATGLVVREYRGRDCKETWKFDAGLMTAIRETLKQIAIEEGEWAEKREPNAAANLAELTAKINQGRDRLAAAKKAALARGEKWR